MQPNYKTVINYKNLIDNWFRAAEIKESNADNKSEIYFDTKIAVKKLRKLNHDPATKGQADKIANKILKALQSHSTGESETLAIWVASHTTVDGDNMKGAYKSLHKLFEVVRNVKNNPAENSGIFAVPNQIDSASIRYIKLNDFSIKGHKNREEPMSPSVTQNQLVSYSENDNQASDTIQRLLNIDVDVDRDCIFDYCCPLKELKLTTPDHAIEFAKEYGQKLQYIDISGIDFSDNEKLEELAQLLPNLNTFVAKNIKLNVDGVKIITKYFKNLHTLSLGSNHFGADGAALIADSENSIHLHTLLFDREPDYDAEEYFAFLGTPIGNEGIKALAASKYLINLRVLDLGGNDIFWEGVIDLAASKTLKLEELILNGNAPGMLGFRAIVDSPEAFNNLKKLSLSCCGISDPHVNLLLTARNLTKLEKLNLGGNVIYLVLNDNVTKNEVVEAFNNSEILETLKKLDISSQRLSSNIAEELRKLDNFKDVKIT